MQKIVMGADHRGFYLKESLKKILSEKYEIIDVGTNSPEMVDYPDITVKLVKHILSGEAERGILICGSGVGACVAANKFKNIRAGMCHDVFSAHQGVEDDDMNVLCLGSGVVGESLAIDIINSFLNAKFKSEERYKRRLDKIKKIEDGN
jgi:ribose 5-phosphate isomerase B